MPKRSSTELDLMSELLSEGDALPRREASTEQPSDAASYSRFSSALQDDDSLDQQQRACREVAERNGDHILPPLEFSDEAVSGTKLNREGLKRLIRAARSGLFRKLYVYSLSRIARETAIAIPLIKTLVHRYQIRVISVAEGLDSAGAGWDVMLHMLSLTHELYIRDLAKNVRRGQEAAQRRGQSTGDYCLGYGSIPAPGCTPSSDARRQKVPKVVVIDDDKANWVRRIFDMYTVNGYSLLRIAKELNRLGAPKDHRASTKRWHPTTVRNVLANPKYTGRWRWGQTKVHRDPTTGRTTHEVQPEEEQQRWRSERPELRIISDAQYQLALERLANTARTQPRKQNGQLAGATSVVNGRRPRQLLSCLIVCGHCGGPFYVTGVNGKYLGCSKQITGDCVCKTKLQRKRAERLILTAIGQVILQDSSWREKIVEATQMAWRSVQSQLTPQLHALETQKQSLRKKIDRLVDQAEEDEAPADLRIRLTQRRDELNRIQSQINNLASSATWSPQEPDRDWITAQLRLLHDVLHDATPAAAVALRSLVNGKIVVEQVLIPTKKRGFLRGRFKLAISAAVAKLAPPEISGVVPDEHAAEIVIDFVDQDRKEILAEQAWNLHQAGKLHKEIAEALRVSRNFVNRLLKRAAAQHGRVYEDGRARHGRIKQEQGPPCKHEQIAAQVMELYNQGLYLQDIAQKLTVNRDQITLAVRFWHESHGLPVPDGRNRRKALKQEA